MNTMFEKRNDLEETYAAGRRSSQPRLTRSAKPLQALAVLAGLAMAGGITAQAYAAPPGGPTENEVFSGCNFDPAALNSMLNISNRNALTDGNVVGDYIVIYRMDSQNNGQELKAGGFTGAIVCVANTKVTSASAEGVPIPNDADQPGGSTSVDVLATQAGSVLQYRVNGGSRNGDIENRICISTDTGVDCDLIQEPLQ